MLGLSLTVSSNFIESVVPLHSRDVPIFVFRAEDKDLGTLGKISPGKTLKTNNRGSILRRVVIFLKN